MKQGLRDRATSSQYLYNRYLQHLTSGSLQQRSTIKSRGPAQSVRFSLTRVLLYFLASHDLGAQCSTRNRGVSMGIMTTSGKQKQDTTTRDAIARTTSVLVRELRLSRYLRTYRGRLSLWRRVWQGRTTRLVHLGFRLGHWDWLDKGQGVGKDAPGSWVVLHSCCCERVGWGLGWPVGAAGGSGVGGGGGG